jgi:hypothetical protein
MQIEPSISYQNLSTQIRISWTLADFESVAGKNSTSGFKGCYIRSNYSSNKSYIGSTTYIRIYSEFLDAWNTSLNQLFDEPVSNEYISIQKNSETNPTYVEIIPGTKSLYIEMVISTIQVQIGPGIVIQS